MTVTVCIGSGCHVKGSRGIINLLKDYIDSHQLDLPVELSGCFCLNQCTEGVVVKFNDHIVTNITKDNIIFLLEDYLKKGE